MKGQKTDLQDQALRFLAAEKQLSEALSQVMVSFAKSKTEPLQEEIKYLKQFVSTQEEEIARMKEEFSDLRLHLENAQLELKLYKEHSEVGRLWLSEWTKSEEHAAAFKAFYEPIKPYEVKVDPSYRELPIQY